MTGIFDPDLLASSIRIMTPILLAGLGGLLCIRASVFNIGLEGFMLVGAFFAVFVGDRTGSSALGIMGGFISGVILSIIYGFMILRLKANMIVVGIATNLMAFGLTSFLLRAAFGESGVYRPTNIEPLPYINIPFIEDIPVIGQALSGHTILVYISLLFIVVTYLILFKTSLGINIRAVGEHPQSARTAGINPALIQTITILWSGALCGLAGAHLSIGYVFEFSDNMIQGRGFTAFTAIVFGGSHPVWTAVASWIFGFAEAMGFRLQLEQIGLPPTVVQMFPYILAIVVLTISSALRQKSLAASGEC